MIWSHRLTTLLLPSLSAFREKENKKKKEKQEKTGKKEEEEKYIPGTRKESNFTARENVVPPAPLSKRSPNFALFMYLEAIRSKCTN